MSEDRGDSFAVPTIAVVLAKRYEQCLLPYIEALRRAEQTEQATEAAMDQRKVLTFKELRAYGVLYSRQHVDRLERAGKFPKRVPLGTFRVGWLESEIISYMRTLVAQRSRQLGTIGSAGKVKSLPRPRRHKTDPLTGGKVP